MKTAQFLFPEGRPKALTMSYDDGVLDDRRLVKLFNERKIKGTFHVNYGLFDQGNRLKKSEVKDLYHGHEVSCHSLTHPFLERCPKISMVNQVLEDRKGLEELVGYPVRGMSYPMGTYSPEVLEVLESTDIVYSRTTISTGCYGFPHNWLEWHPTCHHNDNLLDRGKKFLDMYQSFCLMYVWGHSYEFDRDNNWDLIEDFCDSMAGKDSIWYATNIEIYNYVTALRRLEFFANGEKVYNPSVLPVWLKVADKTVNIPSGELVTL